MHALEKFKSDNVRAVRIFKTFKKVRASCVEDVQATKTQKLQIKKKFV